MSGWRSSDRGKVVCPMLHSQGKAQLVCKHSFIDSMSHAISACIILSNSNSYYCFCFLTYHIAYFNFSFVIYRHLFL